jgi:ATP-binding protein involved in chromosome partitioning
MTVEEIRARLVGLSCSLTPHLRGLLGDLSWEERIGSVTFDPAAGSERITLEFISDGLNLAAKTELEEFVTSEMRRRYPDVGKWIVYMRRKNPQPAAVQQRPQSGATAASSTGERPASKLAGTRKAIDGVKSILAVASGKGGVGKSTVSVNLAVSLANQGYRVGLLDADIYGPSIPMMLGIESEPSVNERNKIVPPERDGIKVMSFGFFAGEDSAVIWRGPMIMKALQQFFYDVDWGELDYLVIDLPPGTGDAQLTLVQSLPVDGAVIVTTPQNVALLDAVKGIVMFQKTELPVLGIVENMSTYHCPACGSESHVFGQGGADAVSAKYGIPVLGYVPLNGQIREAGDSGNPLSMVSGHPVRVRFAEIASRVTERLQQLRQQNLSGVPNISGAPQKISPLVAARGE